MDLAELSALGHHLATVVNTCQSCEHVSPRSYTLQVFVVQTDNTYSSNNVRRSLTSLLLTTFFQMWIFAKLEHTCLSCLKKFLLMGKKLIRSVE